MKFKPYLTAFVLMIASFAIAQAPIYPTTTSVTPLNADDLHSTLVTEVFGACGVPTGAAAVSSSSTWNGYPYQTLTSGARFFNTGADRLLIVHGGHNQNALNSNVGGPLIQYALPIGWDILALDMPTGNHSRFANDAHPLTNFINPVWLSLNYVLSFKDYDNITMTGLSGGGWTTVLYAALDTRIDYSVPVAGSWPKYLRYASGNINSIGDYEQTLPGLSLNYLDLYAMATSNGREQLQVFNSDDPCCFDGDGALTYLVEVSDAATALGGTFDLVIVENSTHTIHSSVFGDIAGEAPPPPPFVPFTAHWKLDELAGSILADSNGSFHATAHNGPTFGEPGLVLTGTSTAFDGNSDYATLADNVNLRPGTKEYSVELWAAFTGTHYGMAFGKFSLAYPYTGVTVFFNLAGETQTPGRVQLRDKRQSGYWVDSNASGLNDGQPRYYVFQRRETAPGTWKLELYIDGYLDSETILPSVEDLNTSEKVYLFSRPGASQYVQGAFDDVKYHVGSALTPAEILVNYNALSQ